MKEEEEEEEGGGRWIKWPTLNSALMLLGYANLLPAAVFIRSISSHTAIGYANLLSAAVCLV